ncbi:MAG: long-chain fatty acid--CoA ligase [Desulfobacteraceae bacterium]|nr:long-chain fatty acid--CoA ligase [Desulfobacteraceae bacterium]
MRTKDFTNIQDMLKHTIDDYRDNDAYRWFSAPDRLESITWGQFQEQVKKVSKSLISLGVKKGDKVNIISSSCYRWVLSDIGIASIGACTVGIYHSNLPDDCRYIIDHSDAVIIFAEDEVQLQKLMSIRDEIPDIKKVIMFSDYNGDDDWVINFDQFLALGSDTDDQVFEKMAGAVGPQDPAAIVYTSGTTGVPKGAVLTHDNLTFTAQSVTLSSDLRAGDHHFLFLPLAHVFAKICVFGALEAASTTTFARDITTVIEDIGVARPHWFASVPRIYEKVYSKVISGAETKGGAALKIFNWACKTGEKYSNCILNNQPIPFFLNLQYKLATKLVFTKIQVALGGRVRWCISGAAPIDPSIAKFFHSAGILILEGIGMTENTSFTNLNRHDNYRFGWVGQPGYGIEQKICEDGEVMFKGRNVMKEYYKMPEKTAETLTPDGWMYTGDLGEIDGENFLKITGRKKDLIITAGGKNIAPSGIEGVMATSKYMSQVCIIGDKRKFLSAIVTLDPETVPEYARNNNLPFDTVADLVENPEIKALIDSEIEAKNKNFASFETIKKIVIMPEFSIDNGLLTPTLKMKKSIIITKYEKEVDALYQDI